jgi:hypothetical protein
MNRHFRSYNLFLHLKQKFVMTGSGPEVRQRCLTLRQGPRQKADCPNKRFPPDRELSSTRSKTH